MQKMLIPFIFDKFWKTYSVIGAVTELHTSVTELPL